MRLPRNPCGCELFDVTIVSEGPSLVRVDLYGEYSDWFDFYEVYDYPPLLIYVTFDHGRGSTFIDQGEMSPHVRDISTSKIDS